jgi:hypothetical protein
VSERERRVTKERGERGREEKKGKVESKNKEMLESFCSGRGEGGSEE